MQLRAGKKQWQMQLLDQYIPHYQFSEIHSITISAYARKCYLTAMELDLSQSAVIRFLFRLRGLPFEQSTLDNFTDAMKFTLLEQQPFSGFLYGFGYNNSVERITDKNNFSTTKKYKAKAGWSFEFKEHNGQTTITTETRVYCLTPKTKIRFGVYWFFIKPFSGWIRLEMLRLIKKKSSSSFI